MLKPVIAHSPTPLPAMRVFSRKKDVGAFSVCWNDQNAAAHVRQTTARSWC